MAVSKEYLDELRKRYAKALGNWNKWTSLWQECYELTLPERERFYGSDSRGDTNTDRIYDSTASIAIQEFGLPVEEVHYTYGNLKADKLMELGVSKHWDDDDDEILEEGSL